ncbi:acetyltransferase [Nitratireductor indicus C115]|uniref:Acetyltransferase n=1 Tax=Nitratireductor indicus C115 TaxID=1231190 RepID=K2PR99_9HYPH|nr:GNAT family N-acetyltransferase [Nitratireductor indicus]EKF43557.1 acetyltransferase [Nitratireductor indicus C115]SFQ04879.1 Ribosomal protein S18 acetylase RimI [Nitratireductor indicus]
MNGDGVPIIRILDGDMARRHLKKFGALLHACVLDGASVGFILPFTQSQAEDFWREKVFSSLGEGRRILLSVWIGEYLAGTVQLVIDTMPNQSHRAEASKLLVDPVFRRRGLARLLMIALEDEARRRGRTLITLDTRTGDKAEPLYSSLGFETSGIIPGYCLDAHTCVLDATTIMYKHLTPQAG